MYDIFCDIWKNPEHSFTPMPLLSASGALSHESVSAEISQMRGRGIDGFLLSASGGEYLSECYFASAELILKEAKKRFMSVVLAERGLSIPGIIAHEERLAARRLYALPAHTTPPANEELLYRISVRLDENGKLTDTRLDCPDGYTEYDLVLGYSYASDRADLLNPHFAAMLSERVLEEHQRRFGEYFGTTVIGLLTETPAFAEGEVPWTYDFIEDFFEAGGDFHLLASLFFEPREKKFRREAEYALRKAVSARLDSAYFTPLSRRCAELKLALMGSPAESAHCDLLQCFDVPGAKISAAGAIRAVDRSSEAVQVKLAADCARHSGYARSLTYLRCGELSPNELMRELNFAFARGSNLILSDALPLHCGGEPIADSVRRGDFKKLTSYIKRMSWLASAGTNNPVCAVLCTPEYVPHKPTEPLAERGFSFNYLSLSDLMNRASVRDGKLCIDRYEYGVLLIDSRLRLDAESVTKIGRFVTEGGKMYRGGDFIGFIEKNAKQATAFASESGGTVRFSHITKSGCDFFVMINEGDAAVCGTLITDLPCEASDFDALTGEITPISCALADGGFSYPVTVPPNAVKVIGMNKNALPHIAEPKKLALRENVSLSDGRMGFDYRADYSRAVISFTDVPCGVSVAVNGADAGRILFSPLEIDITKLVTVGANAVELDGEFEGCSVKMYGEAGGAL